MSKPEVKDGTLTYPIWWRTGGGGLINRDCLDHDHPEQTYNYLKRHGIRPEDYGVKHPRLEEMMQLYGRKSKEDLMIELMNLRDELTALHRAGFL